MKTKPTFIAICYLLSAIFELAFAQGTAFTYQGRLNDGSSPATGIYDLRFTIYDSTNLPGVVIAGPLTNSATGVSNGLFTVTLDFGAAVFNGNSRWLEIAARTNLGGSGAFSLLSPRQPITSAPYATRAANAGLASGVTPGGITAAMLAPGAVSSLDSPNGSITGVLKVANSGLIGVGTSTPQAGLDLAGGKTISAPTLLSTIVDETGSFTNLGGSCLIAVNGNLLAVSANGDDAFTLVDITNPTNLVMLSSIRNGTGNFTNLLGASDVVWSSNLLAIGAFDGNAVTLVDTTTSASPVWRSVLRDGVGGFNDLGGAFSLNLTSNVLAVAAVNDNAVTLVDVSTPSAPVLRVTIKDGTFGFNELGGAAGLARQGNLLAVAAFTDNAVTLIDVSNPSNPVLRAVMKQGVGGFTNLDGAYGLAFSGNLLAIGSFNDNAVTLVDVSNPSSPVLLSSVRNGVGGFEGLNSVARLAFQGSTLWITPNSDSAVTALDVSNPSAPVLKSIVRNGTAGFSHLTTAGSLAIHGNVILAGAESAVTLFDSTTTAQVGLLSEQWVGIGVSQPMAALDVRGNVIVEGAQTFAVNATMVNLGDSLASGAQATAMGQSSALKDFSTAMGFSTASGRSSTAAGQSTASGDYSVAMGRSTASANTSIALGDSIAAGPFSVALGASTASNSVSVAMGVSTAVGAYSTAVGYLDLAAGDFSFAAGQQSEAHGNASVALGEFCVAKTNYAFALGRDAVANHVGAFVWADAQGSDFASTTNNQFLIRAAGGVGIGTTAPGAPLHVAAGSAGSVTANANSIAAFEKNGTGYVSLLGPVASEVGIVFGNPNAATDGSIIYNNSSARSGFLFRTGTNTTQMAILANGNVGIGTISPSRELEVQNTNDTEIGIKSTDAGGHLWTLQSSSVSGSANLDASFQIIDRTLGGARLFIGTNGFVGIGTTSPTNKLHVAGGVSATVFVTTSDRNAKENFESVSPAEVLDKVTTLPITRWTFKEMPGQKHLGPMAQDFHAAFDLGAGDTGIATVDESGVALAAIQGLNDKVEVRSQKSEVQIQKLEAENAELKQRLDALEKIVLSQKSN